MRTTSGSDFSGSFSPLSYHESRSSSGNRSPKGKAPIRGPLPEEGESSGLSRQTRLRQTVRTPSTSTDAEDQVLTPGSSQEAHLLSPSLANALSELQLSQSGISNVDQMRSALDVVARGLDGRSSSLTPPPEPSTSRNPVSGEIAGRRPRRSSARPVDKTPHLVSNESQPEHPFHTAEFQQAFRDTKKLMSDMQRTLNSSALCEEEGSTISQLQAETRRLAAFQYPSSRIVAFVGSSGVGEFLRKSHTLSQAQN